MINELESRFGTATEEQKKWVAENLGKLEQEQKEIFLRELNKISNGQFPDISTMKNLLVKITGKRPKEYIWAVCLECGCEYDYGLPMCPACYDKGLDCRARAVKKSEFQPPMKVIRYNKQYQHGDKGETVCYDCVHKTNHCNNYGNPNWNCHREEFESCPCARCCSIAKRINAELEKTRSNNKLSYAMPLKRG